MKRLFMTFAAMLLMSVSAFAQSTPISKCDVNGDGIVNVADITAIIGTIKSIQRAFYLGTIEPTAENYKSLSTTRTSIEDAVGTTISVDAGQTVYMLCPTSWMDKWTNAFIEDNSGEVFYFSDDVDVTTIPEYSIYKTQTLYETSIMTLKIQHQNNYYVGLTNPSKTKWTLSDMNCYSATGITSFTAPAVTDNNTVNVMIVPTSIWGTPTSMKVGGEIRNPWINDPTWPETLPAGYTAYFTQFGQPTEITDIVWE